MVSLKMKATASNKGFTLVELIVVITILAILGTIGFISLQGYSAQSRDSKRASDMRSISTAINVTNTTGIGLLTTLTPVAANQLTALPSVGGASTVLATSYQAGTPNYTVLSQNGGNFKDPTTGGEYPVGATTRGGGGFQVAARMEGGGVNTSAVQGSYSARTVTFSAPTGFTATSLTLAAADVGKLKVGDSVTAAVPSAVRSVTNVSSDGLTISLDGVSITAVGTVVYVPDTIGLIKQIGGANPVVDKSITTLPY